MYSFLFQSQPTEVSAKLRYLSLAGVRDGSANEKR